MKCYAFNPFIGNSTRRTALWPVNTHTGTLTHTMGVGQGRVLILLAENDSHFSQTLACNISFHKGQRWRGRGRGTTMGVMRKAPWKFKRSKPHLSLSTWLLGIPECPNSDADSDADCDLVASAWLSQHARVRRNVDRSSSSSSATSAKMTGIMPRITG